MNSQQLPPAGTRRRSNKNAENDSPFKPYITTPKNEERKLEERDSVAKLEPTAEMPKTLMRFNSILSPAIHTASDQVIREKNEKIEELQKRESVAKNEIKKLQKQVSKLQRTNKETADQEHRLEVSQKLEESKWQHEIKMLKFELEKQREANFNLREQMSDALEKEKRRAEERLEEEISSREKNFIKELDNIKAIYRMEKEQIEHRAQKAIADLQLLQIDHSKLI